MEQSGHALEDMYLASSLYVWSARSKDVLGQALMWIIGITTRVTTTSVTWSVYAIAATQERLGMIIARKSPERQAHEPCAKSYARIRTW